MTKPKRLWLLLPLLLALLLGAPHREAEAQSGPAGEILQLVNQLRAEHGLPPYRYNGTLSIAAQNHANWMAANVAYSHTGAGGTSPQDRADAVGYNGYVAENIVGGGSMTPRQGYVWWRNSSIHYRMMVSNRYVEAGVGFASNGTQNMYVLLMGVPASGQRASAPAAEAQSEPLMVTPIELAEPREDGSIVHVVQEGQALWQIGAHYEVELPDLLLYNNLQEDAIIQPGDEIIVRLPDGAPPPPTPTPPLTHVVREGENAWIIAARYQIDVATLFYLNGLTEDSVLHAGNELKIRLAQGETPPPTPTPRLVHVVREGDTLLSIAGQYGVALEEILALNGLSQNAILQIGDEIYVRPTPTPETTPTPLPSATFTPGPTPDATDTPAPEAVALEAAAPAATGQASPTTLASPTPVAPRDAGEGDEGGGWLYAASLLVAGAGLLLFVAVVFRRA